MILLALLVIWICSEVSNFKACKIFSSSLQPPLHDITGIKLVMGDMGRTDLFCPVSSTYYIRVGHRLKSLLQYSSQEMSGLT